MCKWIPIKHSFVYDADVIVSDLPKDGEIVFITLRGGEVGYDVFERVPNDRWKFKHFDIKDVEAWMRFPKPYNLNNRSDLWVPIDTLVRVRNSKDENWTLQYFKCVSDTIRDHKFEAWDDGRTSKTTDGIIKHWRYCELAEEV